MLIDSRNIGRHAPWIAFLIIATAGSLVWFLAQGRGAPEWPGGGSPPGFTFGVAGGLLILFEFALWGRKKVRSWRIGRVQDWMIAHIWLGLLTVPLLVLHSGFRWGGSLSTVLMILFLVVIASGIWGLLLQQYIPSRMLSQVPAETIHSQINRMVLFMADDAHRLVEATCGPLPGEEAEPVETSATSSGAPVSHITVGAVQTVGNVSGKVLLTTVLKAAVPGSEPLRELYRTSIRRYLIEGRKSGSPLAIPSKAEFIFADIRTRLPLATRETIDFLENLCDQRRQLDRQDRLHRLLHNWVIVHLPLSVALVALMAVHIWVALKYR